MTLINIYSGREYDINNYSVPSVEIDYMRDIIGNSGAVATERMSEPTVANYRRIATPSRYIVADGDGNLYTTADNIRWWQRYVRQMRAAMRLRARVIDEQIGSSRVDDVTEALDQYIAEMVGGYDMEDEPSRTIRAIQEWIANYKH